jgi:hypothetical protein
MPNQLDGDYLQVHGAYNLKGRFEVSELGNVQKRASGSGLTRFIGPSGSEMTFQPGIRSQSLPDRNRNSFWWFQFL